MSAETRALRNAVVDDDTIDRWQDRGETYKDRIMRQLKSLAGDAERLYKQAAESSSEGFSGMREQLDRKVERTREKLDRARQVVNQNAQRSTAAARVYVRENPLRSVGMAAAVGVVAGLLVISFLNSRDR